MVDGVWVGGWQKVAVATVNKYGDSDSASQNDGRRQSRFPSGMTTKRAKANTKRAKANTEILTLRVRMTTDFGNRGGEGWWGGVG